jgi:subtilase family serine protease
MLRTRAVIGAVVAGLTVAAGVAAAAPGSQAAPPPDPVTAARLGPVPAIPRSAVRAGSLAPQAALRAEVTLRPRDPAALTAYIAALSDRASPLFRHYLTPAQFGARFGPTARQLAAVAGALRARGLSPGRPAADRLSIPVSAPASALERAFSVTLARYRLPGGRVVFANRSAPRIPAGAVGYVAGVLGLDDLSQPRSLAVRPARSAAPRRSARAVLRPAASGPKACAAATGAASDYGSFTAGQLASYYGMASLYKLGDFGRGVRVALAELEPDSASDIAAYKSCYRLRTAISYTAVDGGPGSGSGSGEAALDIEDLAGLAPDVSIDVYQAPNISDTDTYDLYSKIINADKNQVISTSWGLCELDSDSPLLTSEQALFEQAATQGETVLAASGDFGSTACFPDETVNDNALSVSDPASQPYVVGVGGTTISAAGQTVWNNSSIDNGAGGGGVSATWCMPKYQYRPDIPGLISADSRTNSRCSSASKRHWREVPDVSADANPETGYTIYYAGAWTAIGGTSAAAPLWAAIAALTDASPFCRYYGSGAAGVQAEGLYAVAGADHRYVYGRPAEILADVTSGNNDYTPSGYTAGLYPATTGYDMASGLGSPLVSGRTATGAASNFYPGLTAAMCQAYRTKLGRTTITRISPEAGPAGRPRTVTITGRGFLPIPGADLVLVGRKSVLAVCSSTTKCKVRLPAHKRGTVTVRIEVEDLTLSPVRHFRYQS